MGAGSGCITVSGLPAGTNIIPAGSTIMYDASGNEYLVYPNGTIVFYRSASSSGSGSTSGNCDCIDYIGVTNSITITSLSATQSSIAISSSYPGQTSITTLGVISTGTWQGNTVGIGYGGTNNTSYTTDLPIYYDGTKFVSQENLTNFVYVDGVNGNDTTAVKYRMDRPYQTLNAALSASSSGDTIYVYPATYSPTPLTKDGIRFYFTPGCKIGNNIANGIFYDGGSAITMNIEGYLEVTGGWVVIKQTAASTINAEFKSITVADVAIYQPSGGGNLNLKVHEDFTSDFAAFRIFNNAAVNSTVYIEARNIYSAGNRIGCTNAAGSMKAIIKANKITTNGSQSPLNCISAYATGTNTLDLTIYGNLEKQVSAGAGSIQDPALGCSGWSSVNSGIVRLYGNITCLDTSPALGFGRIGTSVGSMIGWIEVYGNITCNGPAIVTTDASSIVFKVFGDIIGNYNDTLNFAAVETSCAVGSVIELHGLIQNLRNNAAGHGWKKFQGTGGGEFNAKLMQTARIVTTHASADSLTTDGSATQFKVYPGVSANKSVNGSVTQQISTVLVDSNVN